MFDVGSPIYKVSKNLLEEFIRLVLKESSLARVPNQLLSPDGEGNEEKGEPEEVEAAPVHEFSGVGSIIGYSLPLGMNPDDAGRQKNRPRPKKK